MFSSVESCRTNRANKRLVASSIIAIRYSRSPRSSNQSCSLVSHCTNSPNRLRRGRQVWTSLIFAFFPRHSLARIIHCRTVSLLASIPCFFSKYSAASVGPNPWYTGADKSRTASRSISSSIFRLDGCPRSPCTTALSPCFFSAQISRFTCRTLSPNSSAASRCVISFFLAFLSATSRSRSVWVISSCPSCILTAWGLSRGHFYFAQRGHYHFAATDSTSPISTSPRGSLGASLRPERDKSADKSRSARSSNMKVQNEPTKRWLTICTGKEVLAELPDNRELIAGDSKER